MDAISGLDISPDSSLIASGSEDGSLRFWDVSKNQLARTVKASHSGYPTCLQFNPADLCLAAGSSDKIVKYWDL